MASPFMGIKFRATYADGAPLDGGKVWTYAAGTLSPLPTYSTEEGAAGTGNLNTNPVTLDSTGQASIFCTEGIGYRFIVKTKTGVTLPNGDQDNVVLTAGGDGLAFDLSAATGSSLVGWAQTGTGAAHRNLQAKAREIVSPEDFGALGNGSNNDTTAFQAAIASCITTGRKLRCAPGAVYIVNALTIDACENFHLELNGATLKSSGVSSSPLLTVKNSRGVHVTGGLLDGSFSLTQTTLLKIWADNGNGCSYGVFRNIRFRNAQIGVMLGDPARQNEPYVSENTVVASNFIGVLACVKAYGVQGEINLVGCNITPGLNGWTSFPGSYAENAIVTTGANVRVTGGEITSYSTTSAAVIVRPAVSTSGNLYGKVFLVGAWIEVQEQIARVENPASVLTTVGGVVSILQCTGGLLGDNVAAIDTTTDFSGEIRVLNCYLWAATTRTHPNINTAAAATITADSVSFNTLVSTVGPSAGYLTAPTGFTGGRLNYLSGLTSYARPYPLSANTGTTQTVNSMWQGTGAPSNTYGANGDYYFRADTPGTANQRVYVKSSGSWTGIV